MSEDLSDIALGVVLVVGGSGFIGTYCVRDVLQNGATQVHTLNSRIPPELGQIPDVEYHAVDLSDAAGVQRVMELVRPDVVLHLASPRPFIESSAVYNRVNIQGTKNLLAACGAVGKTKAFVYCSSVSVIHDGHSNLRGADESWPVLYAPEQKDPYWQSKAEAERLVLQSNRASAQEMLTTALRVTAVFGKGDDQVIGPTLEQAKAGQNNVQIGDGSNLCDWTYVENVAAAHTHAARRLLRARGKPDSLKRRVEGEAFFISNEDPRPFFDFLRQVAKEAGYPIETKDVIQLPTFMAFLIGYLAEWVVFITSFGRRKTVMSRRVMKFTIIDQYFNVEKAKRQLGFRPSIGIDEGITRSVES